MLGEGLADLRRMPSTVIDEGPQRTRPPLPPGRGRAAPRSRRRAAGAARAAAGRARDLLRPAPRLLGRRAPRARRGARPTSSTTARSSSPTARSASSTGSTRSCRARSAPRRRTRAAARCRSSAGAWAGSSRCSRSPPTRSCRSPRWRWSRARSTSPRSRWSRRCARSRPSRGGAGITQLYRLLGGAPAPLVKRGYQLAGIDKYVMKPWTVLSNLARPRAAGADRGGRRVHGRACTPIPGRTFGQLYHRFFRTNDLADGRFAVTGGTLDLADVRVPVLSVAGRGDGIAPVAACHHVECAAAQRAGASSRRRRAATSAC